MLHEVQNEVHIVTPWINLKRIHELGIFRAMEIAVQRGVMIHIYTDEELNVQGENKSYDPVKLENLRITQQELQVRGVLFHRLKRVHSKIVIADNNLYCVGSFNWFSASRAKDYAMHETSLVYQGIELDHEIKITLESLGHRIIKDTASLTLGIGN
jgi:phosphatidylserine/phosphatidylglycerophosphate/cardiolipin synthase-like enzyme